MGGMDKTSYFLALCVNISKTVRDTSKVIINDQQEVAHTLSIGTKIG